MGSSLFKRFIAKIVINILLISLTVGCARDSVNDTDSREDNISAAPGFVYLAEIIQFPELPDGKTDIRNIVFADNTVFFTARSDETEEHRFNIHSLYSMDIDGTNLIKLPNYVPGSLPLDTARGFVSIDAMHIDSEGNIWVIETRILYESTLPDNLGVHILRKLDKTGAQLSVFDLNGLGDEIYVHALNVDETGNIYIASGTTIYILSNSGNLDFTLDNPNYNANIILLSDGKAAVANRQQNGNVHLTRIDTENKSWGNSIRIPTSVPDIQNVFQGTGEFLTLYNNSSDLIGIIAESGDRVEILNWADSYLSSAEITAIMFLSDRRIAVTRQTWVNTAMGAQQPVVELIILTETAISDLPGRIPLTFGVFDFNSSIRYAVEQFNRTNKTHRIEVIDYSLFGTNNDWEPGTLRLNTEMITGNGPDILDVKTSLILNYASKGMLVDLYPLIDADPELNRNSLIESVLKASEIGDCLYFIIPSFFISTIVGSPAVLGSYPGWNIDEFIEVFSKNPQADMPMGWYSSKMLFLSLALRSNMNEFVDLLSGTAFFDSENFIGLLELSNTFPSDVYTDNVISHELIATGRQIMQMIMIGDVLNYSSFRTVFGGEIVFKGFPTESRNGNAFVPYTSIAITNSCTEIQAAWEFLRIFLLEEYQRDVSPNYTLPVNRFVLEERIEQAMLPLPPGHMISTTEGLQIKNPELSQAEADSLRNLIDSTINVWNGGDVLWNIISENAEDYFNGLKSARDTARIIQSRASIYLSETR